MRRDTPGGSPRDDRRRRPLESGDKERERSIASGQTMVQEMRSYRDPITWTPEDYERISRLAMVGCSRADIALIFDIAARTWDEHLKNDPMLKKALERGDAMMRLSLRKAQMKLARRGNPAMLIFMGKNYLGQADVTIRESEVGHTLADIMRRASGLPAAESGNPPVDDLIGHEKTPRKNGFVANRRTREAEEPIYNAMGDIIAALPPETFEDTAIDAEIDEAVGE